MITGTTNNSRLKELRKYTVSTGFTDQYVNNGSWSSNGVDYGATTYPAFIVYYLGGIKYTDITLINGTHTTFEYSANNVGNFVDEVYIKNPNKEKIISNPKINDDVFIIRDELSAFNKNYRLEFVGNLVDLTTYAGGKYFKIINNT